MKRLFDFLLAIPVAATALIALAVFGPAIRRQSGGDALFRQPRVGQNEQTFTCYKLRTMPVDTPSVASHDLPNNAPTRIGAFLRRSKLDELPQAFNVLRGEMSFVGPRPCLLTQTDLVRERRVRGVYAALPGITGAAQVAGIDMSDPVRLAEADAAWLATRSFWGDVKIFAETFFSVSEGRQVRKSGGRT